MKNDLKCKDCNYFWLEVYDDGSTDDYAICHFERRTCWDIPPCEQEIEEE